MYYKEGICGEVFMENVLQYKLKANLCIIRSQLGLFKIFKQGQGRQPCR